jgi:ubiquinone/menaquinone biosynthesis C-methylase UbiE
MRRLMTALYDRSLHASEEAGLRVWRRDLLQDLSGEVLEVGAGTGLNLPHYRSGVRRLVLMEPDWHMRARLSKKPLPPGVEKVEVVDGKLEALPLPDASFDAVVSTLVLCSVDDLERSLAEVRRVLRPGGRFVFLDHVADEANPRVRKWQERLEPLWKWVSGDCHLARRTEPAIRAAGFEIQRLERADIPKVMALGRPSIRGVALKPA